MSEKHQIVRVLTDKGSNGVYVNGEKVMEYGRDGDSSKLLIHLMTREIIGLYHAVQVDSDVNISKALKMVEKTKDNIGVEFEYAATLSFYEHENGISE